MDAAPMIDPHCTRLKIDGHQGLVTDVDQYRRHTIPPDQDGWRTLGESIGRHENLQELIFCEFESTPENLPALLMGVSHNRSLRTLTFDGLDGDWPLEILGTFFENNRNLCSLAVQYSNPSHEFVRSLSTVFKSCAACSLEEIRWVQVPSGDAIISEFIASLAGLSELKKLVLHSNYSNVGRRMCDAMAALLSNQSCTLQKIDLSWNSIGDEGLTALEPAVATNSTLKSLRLSRNGDITPAAWISFVGILRSPTCILEKLHLGYNIFNDDAMVAFADALSGNNTLKEIWLSADNGISPAAWISFAGIFRSPISILETLYLNENILNDDVVVAFADALSNNTTLKNVWFSQRSSISDIGWTAISRTLFDGSSIINMHNSNHTLSCIDGPMLPGDLQSYLQLNEDGDKRAVARKKIFIQFFEGDFDMEPFNENNMDSKVLPHLLSWIGRVPNGKRFMTFFGFLRRAPTLCENCGFEAQHQDAEG